MKIGDAAKVFRCSLKRDEAPGVSTPIIWERHGLEKWNEVRVENIDPLTGFISPPFLTVRIEKDPDRDAVKPADTVLCYQGAIERIRRPGMLVFEWACIPARNLAIIRPNRVDPLWLFYSIREAMKTVEPEIRSGRGFLSMERIREMEIGEYSEKAAERIGSIHKEIAAGYRRFLNSALMLERRVGRVFKTDLGCYAGKRGNVAP